MGPKKKQKKDPVFEAECLAKQNQKYIDVLFDKKKNIVKNTKCLPWVSNGPSTMHFWKRLKEGSTRCTMNACRNLFILPTWTFEAVGDANTLWKYKILKPILRTATYPMKAYIPNFETVNSKKGGTTTLDAAMNYLATFLRPRVEFRRWNDKPLVNTVDEVANGHLLPMYLISLYAEPVEKRKHWYSKPNDLMEAPIGQTHVIGVDLREGRNCILCDIQNGPVPYTHDAFQRLLQYGILACYRVFKYVGKKEE
jgi:hypothetical protein